MQELQANTAIKVKVGPFVDVGDGFTPETGVTLGAADEAELFKHDAAAVTDISGNTWAAIGSCDGWYNLTLSTTDTNTEGLLDVIVQDDSVCLPVHCRFMVSAQAAYISKYTAKDTGYMDVDIKAVGGTATPHSSGKLHILDDAGNTVANESKQDIIDTNVDSILDDTGSAGVLLAADQAVDATKISGSSTAADNVESVFTGSGHTDDVDLSARKLKLDCDTDVAFEVLSSDDSAIKATSTATDKHGMELRGEDANTLGSGLHTYGRKGIYANGQAYGLDITGTTGVNVAGVTHEIKANIHGTIDTVTSATDAETKLDTVIADTEDIQTQVGTAGAGLTDLGGMSTGMKAEVESEVDDAIGGGTGTALTAIPWNSSWDVEVQSECADALTTYDPPTRGEATTDKDAIITEVNANETKIDTVDTVVDGIQTDLSNATDGLGALKTEIDANETKIDTVDTVVDGIQTDLSNATDGLGALKTLIDTVDGVVDAVLVDTDSTIPNLVTTVDTVVDAIKAKTDGLPSGAEKGVEKDIAFPMFLSSDHETFATGKTITEEVSKDKGNFAACTNNSAEIQTTGVYGITLTATEMDANLVILRFTETDCDATIVVFLPT